MDDWLERIADLELTFDEALLLRRIVADFGTDEDKMSRAIEAKLDDMLTSSERP